ncbi:MAG TPA: 6-carboxytetrahydropterin synthase [Phenylobacterium sp.]|uniref:6-pyruvoyl trahydropterin synthase family protein n=1 Tax=Phenylobacterium sp. TaxID=1871053 RepID=UPI002F942C22
MIFTSTKTYGAERGLSCAYRQWAAESQCALLHGYSLGFRFEFAAEQLDRRGWVVDFGRGGFGAIRDWLHEMFDHTLLVAEDDPDREIFKTLADHGLAELRFVPTTSCEGLAALALTKAQEIIEARTKGRCWVVSVTCMEHGANSATCHDPQSLHRQMASEALRKALSEENA